MITCIKSRRVIFPDGIRPGCLYVSGGKLLQVGGDAVYDRLMDFGDDYLSPGFIDLHTHGAVGYSFAQCDDSGVLEACRYHLTHGTTTLLPTISAAPMKEMAKAVATVAAVIDSGICPVCLPGVHMEGPYLSKKQCGAQVSDHITPPIEEEYTRLLSDYGKYIARWTYAPENDEDQHFCKCLKRHGILPSVGHSDATYEQLQPAYEAGCSLVTHLYSCTSTITRTQGYRHLGIIESAYLLEEMDVELIADGKHLPPELLKMILKCKDHRHIALVTDSLAAAGTNHCADAAYIIEDGVCKLPDRSAFAGSIATMDQLVRNALAAGCTLEDAVSMASAVPARILNLPKGKLEKGMDADLVVFDDSITVKAVLPKESSDRCKSDPLPQHWELTFC